MTQSSTADTHQDSYPDERGHFGTYGGRFVAETLMRPLDELNEAYRRYLQDPEFLAEIDRDHVILDTIKKAEDTKDIIVRLYEAHGQRGPVNLTFNRPIKKATECNLMEERDQKVNWKGSTVRFPIRPYEIRTFKITF